MKSISVSTGVFAAIWANRIAGEETENEILERLLGLNAAAAGRQSLNSVSRDDLSGKKPRWVDDIVAALQELGGGGYYEEIYRKVREIRIKNGRSVPVSFKQVVRKEIEINSSDSHVFQSRNDFFLAPKGKGAGYWALRNHERIS